MQELEISKLLKSVVAYKGSDLLIKSGYEPYIRIDGRYIALNLPQIVSTEEVEEVVFPLLTELQKEILLKERSLQFRVKHSKEAFFRATFSYFSGGLHCHLRIIPTNIPSMDDLAHPSYFKELVKMQKGLIIFSGPAGSGKMTSIAAMIKEINETDERHIAILEETRQFEHASKKSIISHIGLNEENLSWPQAVKMMLIMDLDVLYIEEMNTVEKMKLALDAVEQGCLVIVSHHLSSTIDIFESMVMSVDPNERQLLQNRLSNSLISIITQSLVPKIGGGRIAVHEIMRVTLPHARYIKHGDIIQLSNAVQKNMHNCQSMNSQLEDLWKKRILSKEIAISYSTDPESLILSRS